jgi:hypothetical protein
LGRWQRNRARTTTYHQTEMLSLPIIESDSFLKFYFVLAYSISIDFGSFGECEVHEQTRVDSKIILFKTPACPMPMSDENIQVAVVIKHDILLLARIDFDYLTRKPVIHELLMHITIL